MWVYYQSMRITGSVNRESRLFSSSNDTTSAVTLSYPCSLRGTGKILSPTQLTIFWAAIVQLTCMGGLSGVYARKAEAIHSLVWNSPFAEKRDAKLVSLR